MHRRRLLATCGTVLAATAGCLQPPGPWEAPDIDEDDLRVVLSGPTVATVGDRVSLRLTVENGMLNPGAFRDTLRRAGDGPVDPVDVDDAGVEGDLTVASEGGSIEVREAYRGGDAMPAGTTRRGWLAFPGAIGAARTVTVAWNRNGPGTPAEVRWTGTVGDGCNSPDRRSPRYSGSTR